jgi:mRNA interferase MazF
VGGFVRGDIVVLQYPFSDLSGSKRRPALVLADLPGDDIVLCQITSRARFDAFSVVIGHDDFASGSLPKDSLARMSKLFTADKSLISSVAGHITQTKFDEAVDIFLGIFGR